MDKINNKLNKVEFDVETLMYFNRPTTHQPLLSCQSMLNELNGPDYVS